MKVRYSGFDISGEAVSNVIDAATVADAGDALRRQGIFVDVIGPDTDGAKAFSGRPPGTGSRLKNMSMFSRQLQVLISTGTPLAQSLGALERQSADVSFRNVVGDLRARVESGSALSVAMAEHPGYFDPVSRSLVAAGESAGNLAAMLDRLAVLSRKQLQTRRAVVGAMIYPSLLIVVAVAVLATMLIFVLPRFEELFKSLDTPLPPTTKALMFLSRSLLQYWWAVLIIIGSTSTASWLWIRSPAGKHAFDSIILRIPQLGAIVKSFSTARIARLLGILLQARISLIESLELTRGSCPNHHYAKLVDSAITAVTRGESLANSFANERLVAPSVQEAVLSGERSGQLAPLLTTLADFLEETNEVTIKSLTSIVEPLILIVLGVLVGFVAISLFMPLFDLTAATGGGR
jgi:type II secretory pathway component PulF